MDVYKAVRSLLDTDTKLNPSTSLLSPVYLGLSLVGLTKVVYLLTQLVSFVHLHFIHSSQLPRYRRPGAWALVTGSSQGIGEAFARQLAGHGFNVVLHGRNEEKLRDLAGKLEDEYPQVSFRYVVADGATSHGMKQAIQRIAQEMSALPGPLTILINNIGSMHGVYGNKSPMMAVQDTEPADVDAIININARFTAQITRALLPILADETGKSQHNQEKPKPFLILNLGSIAAIGFPFSSVYSGTKAFIHVWSNALNQELDMQPRYSAGECLCFVAGEVTNASGKTEQASFTKPSAGTFARAALGKVGCGRTLIRPHLGHDIPGILLDALPEWGVRMIGKSATAQQRDYWQEREARLSKAE